MVEPTLDAQISQFRRSLEHLLQEMAEIVEAPLPLEKAFDALLFRLEGAIGANATGVWLQTENFTSEGESDSVELVFDRAISSAKFSDGPQRRRHRQQLGRVLSTGESLHLQPGDVLNRVLLLAPIRCGDRIVGVLEVEVDPSKIRQGIAGRLQFAEKVGTLVGRAIRNRRFTDLDRRSRIWEGLDSFLQTAAAGRSVVQTSYLIANEGRRFIRCDRLTVLRRRGGSAKVVAISGQETVAKRANSVRLLTKLTSAVLKHGEPLVYDGNESDEWPTPVRKGLDQYLRANPSRFLVVKPLFDPERSKRGPNRPAEAALVAEIMQGDPPDDSTALRLELVARHGGRALFRSIDESRVLLRPVLHPVGQLFAGAVSTKTRKIVFWSAVGLAFAATMLFVPVPFRVEGKGRLYPRDRQKIFAPLGGIVATVHVKNGSVVQTGSDLITLQNHTLLQELLRNRREYDNKRDTLEHMMLAQDRPRGRAATPDEVQLEARRIELEIDVKRLERGVEILHQEVEKLRVRSPRSGTVLDWNPEEILRKHCQPGEEILELGDVDGEWIVEVDFPEKNATVIGQQTADDSSPSAHFLLSSAPNTSYAARLEHLGAAVRVIERENVLRGRCQIVDLPPPTLLRSGLEVRVRVDCGRRPLGYVVFRDVVDFVRGLFFY